MDSKVNYSQRCHEMNEVLLPSGLLLPAVEASCRWSERPWRIGTNLRANEEAGNILTTSLTYSGGMMSWLEEEVGIHSKTVTRGSEWDRRDQSQEALDTETRLHIQSTEKVKICACGASHQQLHFCPILQTFDEVKLDTEQKNGTPPHEISSEAICLY